MSMMEEKVPGHTGRSEGGNWPWMHIIGFVISILLTLIALRLVLAHAMGPAGLFVTIMVLAVLQILVQLFFFMHILEGGGPRWHLWMLTLGFIFVFTIIAGSIWIMTFGAESY
ncbi:cytochrome o ubiquinol oxidase subunit IV [Alicyclobacillus kakegawensis]|uniref:cytochrome o ubiquinol oxidase subunit IV n=1 Tax=Alicyclobacillus kakegawensis TaxID=392012 RepID=UPI000AD53D3A